MEYYVDHRNDHFYIITNADDKNYRVSALSLIKAYSVHVNAKLVYCRHLVFLVMSQKNELVF